MCGKEGVANLVPGHVGGAFSPPTRPGNKAMVWRAALSLKMLRYVISYVRHDASSLS